MKDNRRPGRGRQRSTRPRWVPDEWVLRTLLRLLEAEYWADMTPVDKEYAVEKAWDDLVRNWSRSDGPVRGNRRATRRRALRHGLHRTHQELVRLRQHRRGVREVPGLDQPAVSEETASFIDGASVRYGVPLDFDDPAADWRLEIIDLMRDWARLTSQERRARMRAARRHHWQVRVWLDERGQ